MERYLIKRKEHPDDCDKPSKKSKCDSIDENVESAKSSTVMSVTNWTKIRRENLNCDYCLLYSKSEAAELVKQCESCLEYNTGQLAKVQIYGKWHDIPRQQVAHGDQGLSYHFSNNTIPAKPWNSLLLQIKEKVTQTTGWDFNFVLINKYRNGNDHMGEHRDDEKELRKGHPIASLSLGQARDFVFKHADSRGKDAKRKIEPVKILLEGGSLLMMNSPTNTYWYHSLPPRKRVDGVRINMTFRYMEPSKVKTLQ